MRLMLQVYSAPKPKWTTLKERRLQNWGGTQTSKGMLKEPLPKWLQSLTLNLHQKGFFHQLTPNHVLVNEYLSGQGIMPHEDGPFFSPIICTITLGSHCVIKFYSHSRDTSEEDSKTAEEKEMNTQSADTATSSSSTPSSTTPSELPSFFEKLEKRRVLSLYLEPNSLVVLSQDMYTKYLHGIEPIKEDNLASVLETCVNAKRCPSLQQYFSSKTKSEEGAIKGENDKNDNDVDNDADSEKVNNVTLKSKSIPRGTRVSLTIRHAPSVISVPIQLGKKFTK